MNEPEKIWLLTGQTVEILRQSPTHSDCWECLHNGEKIDILKTEIHEKHD